MTAEATGPADDVTQPDVAEFPGGVRAAIEAVLMVADEPVTELALAAALVVPTDVVAREIHDLRAEYDAQRRGFGLRHLGGGWRIYSRHEYGPVVERFVLDGQRARLTQAALETLAVVAYRQPVSRGQIGVVRGVNADGVVRTLLGRGLIAEVGTAEEHGAVLYGTTPYFLERMGLDSLDELPPLAPHLPDGVDLDAGAGEDER